MDSGGASLLFWVAHHPFGESPFDECVESQEVGSVAFRLRVGGHRGSHPSRWEVIPGGATLGLAQRPDLGLLQLVPGRSHWRDPRRNRPSLKSKKQNQTQPPTFRPERKAGGFGFECTACGISERSDFRFQISDFRFQISDFRFQIGHRTSDIGHRTSDIRQPHLVEIEEKSFQ